MYLTEESPDINPRRLGVESIKDLTLEEVQVKIADFQKELKKLQHQEDEFNKNAAMIPDNDPNVTAANDRIQSLREEVERLSNSKQQLSQQLRIVHEARTAIFLTFTDSVSTQVQEIYSSLTRKGDLMGQTGKAQLFVEDRHNPFEKALYYYPQPPGRSVVYDVSQLSGGEKTVAALSLIFAMIQVYKPPLLLLDEVDAFLDAENVSLLTDFIKE